MISRRRFIFDVALVAGVAVGRTFFDMGRNAAPVFPVLPGDWGTVAVTVEFFQNPEAGLFTAAPLTAEDVRKAAEFMRRDEQASLFIAACHQVSLYSKSRLG